MFDIPELKTKCTNHLLENPHVYAHKARRKKIGMVQIEVTNDGGELVEVDLGAAVIGSGGKDFSVGEPETVIRKFREFTWDFLFFAIFDFHPLLIAADLFFLACGPWYNRRVRQQLRDLTNEKKTVAPGKSLKVIVGCPGLKGEPESVALRLRKGGGEWQSRPCEIG